MAINRRKTDNPEFRADLKESIFHNKRPCVSNGPKLYV